MPNVWLAEPDEAEHVARLLIGFRDWYGSSWPSDNAFLAGVEKLMEDPQAEYLLGTPDDDSPPCGVVQLRYRHSIWTAADDAWLEDLFVTEAARRTGLGRALVLAAIDRAEQRNCRRIELDVDDVNEAARALYMDLGFAEKHGGAALMVRPL
jgi:GNAT superfamily N-acetyltransferase